MAGGVDFGENAGTREGGFTRVGHRWRRGTESQSFYLCRVTLGGQAESGSTISNGGEPRSCLGRVFKFKLGSLTQ